MFVHSTQLSHQYKDRMEHTELFTPASYRTIFLFDFFPVLLIILFREARPCVRQCVCVHRAR